MTTIQPAPLVALVIAAALLMISTGVCKKQVAWQPRHDLRDIVRRWRERLHGRRY